MTARYPRRTAGDRGLAVVELAIVVPIISLLVLGVLEFGFLWGSVNRIERTVQNSARTGSGQGDNRYADYDTLRSVAATLAGTDGAEIERVIIYDSLTGDGAVPADCLSIPATGTAPKGVLESCNVYSAQQVLADNPGSFGSSTLALDDCGTGAWDAAWCPTGRSRSTDDPDYVGVYLEVTYTGRTSLIPTTMTVERRAVYQIEPCRAGESC